MQEEVKIEQCLKIQRERERQRYRERVCECVSMSECACVRCVGGVASGEYLRGHARVREGKETGIIFDEAVMDKNRLR